VFPTDVPHARAIVPNVRQAAPATRLASPRDGPVGVAVALRHMWSYLPPRDDVAAGECSRAASPAGPKQPGLLHPRQHEAHRQGRPPRSQLLLWATGAEAGHTLPGWRPSGSTMPASVAVS
jgi:hypothetical protein